MKKIDTNALLKLLIIPDHIPYDYMHLVLQGHCKWNLQKLFKSKSSAIFINDKKALEESLLKMKVPHFINRKPRSPKEINKWKSSEIKLFIFYIAELLLIDYMPSIYFCHFACYIFAIRMLYEQTNIKDIVIAKRLIRIKKERFGKCSKISMVPKRI